MTIFVGYQVRGQFPKRHCRRAKRPTSGTLKTE
nr:MAG TPA: hypothetical protein [Caudoviricetes sp.]